MSIVKYFKKLIPNSLFFYLKKNTIKNKKFFGLNNLDEKILKYLNYNNGFFIELGANDGISQSNTLHYELYKNWRGLLIEPVKKKFDQCVSVRNNKNFFFNCACVSNNYKKKDINLIYSNLRTITDDSKNLINPKKHLNSDDLKFNENHNKITCAVRTLNSILNEINAPKKIDFFSLDTEGYEIEILKGIDFEVYKFRYILIETPNIDLVKNFLEENNYTIVEKLTFHDYLFKSK